MQSAERGKRVIDCFLFSYRSTSLGSFRKHLLKFLIVKLGALQVNVM